VASAQFRLASPQMPHAGARGASLVVKNLPDIKRVFIPEDFGERAGICN